MYRPLVYALCVLVQQLCAVQIITNSPAIGSQNFQANVQATQVDVICCRIRVVLPGCFGNLTQLARLRLVDSLVTALESDAFAHNVRLERVVLSNNRLQRLQQGLFDGLTRLQELDVSGNDLRAIAPGVFHDLTALRRLDLGRNQLSFLDPDAFESNLQLGYLNLAGNRLRQLAGSVFQVLRHLRELNLSSNSLTELAVPLLGNLTALVSLDVSQNLLASLQVGVFRNNDRLKHLKLFGNKLQVIPDGVFADLTALTYLNLASNNIVSIGSRALPNTSRLYGVHLYRNQLTALNSSVVGALNATSELFLGDNPWLCDCNLTHLVQVWQRNGLSDSSFPECERPASLRDTSWRRLTSRRMCPGQPCVPVQPDPHQLEVAFGANITLVCSLCTAEIQWSFLNASFTPLSTDLGNQSTLAITGATLDHAGTYRCLGTRSSGVQEEFFVVTVDVVDSGTMNVWLIFGFVLLGLLIFAIILRVFALVQQKHACSQVAAGLISAPGMNKPNESNRTNQCNPNHKPTGPGHTAGYKGAGTKSDLNNHGNQGNSNNPNYGGSKK